MEMKFELRNFTRNVVHDGYSNFRCLCCLLALFICWGTTGGPDGDTGALLKHQGETINWTRARHVPGCVPLNGQNNEERETLAPKQEGRLDNITRLFSDLGWSGFGLAREYHVYGIWNTQLGCYLWVGQTNQLHARYAQHRNNEKRPFFKNPDNKMIVMAMNMLAAAGDCTDGLFNSVQRQKGKRETESAVCGIFHGQPE